MTDLRIAVVCSSNQNRSMEAHHFLSKRGFKVRSFGTGSQVRLPGPAPDKPNIYDFSTTYDEMYEDLKHRDADLYRQNGLLHMLDRNKRIKPKPERFQSCKEHFDVIISCEERVYDQILEDLETRDECSGDAVHILNINIQDNHEEATVGAFMICDLVTLLSQCDDMENEIDELLQDFESKVHRDILHKQHFY